MGSDRLSDSVEMPLVIHSSEEMQELGRLLGRLLGPGDVVCLRGDLGTGKTTLTQGIAAGMGVHGQVASPTFTLVHEHPGAVPLFHLDAYRLENADELWDLGFEEYLRGDGVVVIEWGERVVEALPDSRLTLWLDYAGDARRVRLE
ncbi:MAG: tRNA (adenosine(37)-N6)-threonylcarbamoyltransferase complex ATPase subunit type 1 TsaE, partial [Armatimonadota bacterium]|nr:tRNA (adenosine(37)-N6)-threonylcarbamoyltransferase complex ATPase subunit type 1 TsaE [Armatimonadota bacterium]